MAGARRMMMIDGDNFTQTQRFYGRPIPKRGQVKAGIVIGLVHSFAALFSRPNRSHF